MTSNLYISSVAPAGTLTVTVKVIRSSTSKVASWIEASAHSLAVPATTMDTVCSEFASLEAPSLYSISPDSPGAMSTNPEPTLVRATPPSNSSILRRIASSSSALLSALEVTVISRNSFPSSASLGISKIPFTVVSPSAPIVTASLSKVTQSLVFPSATMSNVSSSSPSFFIVMENSTLSPAIASVDCPSFFPCHFSPVIETP